MTGILPGRYRHYQGNEYTVIGGARHSETSEELIVYREEYGERALWVRPRAMFPGTVLVGGQEVPRFAPSQSQSGCIRGQTDNIFDDLPQHLPKELVRILIESAHVRIERIVSHGHASAAEFWYDQPQHEWVMVLRGAARLQFEDRMVDMTVGDMMNIPAHQKHRVDWTTPDEPTVWLAVMYHAGDP
ncbi:MAG: DUF1653 domain-containing protein [Planctomycetota bacterium]